jgi:hypothetical protein
MKTRLEVSQFGGQLQDIRRVTIFFFSFTRFYIPFRIPEKHIRPYARLSFDLFFS